MEKTNRINCEIKKVNTPRLETNRLILRKYELSDIEDSYAIYSDEAVNKFLPWFTHKSSQETQKYLTDTVLKTYDKPIGYCYAIELKATSAVIGYVVIHDIDETTRSGGLGYALRQEYWGKGIVAEASRAVLDNAKNANFRYITATHDIKNIGSGEVMKKIGMSYRYSYLEQWMPKDIEVTFRLYQIDFDGEDNTYRGYWDKYPVHFIEKL